MTNGVPRATVVDGREPHAVLLEIFTDEGVGTQVLPGVATKIRKAHATTEESCMTSLHERYAASLMNTFGPPKLVLTRGEGARVWDEDGKSYVDLLGGIAVNALGHGHPALVEAVTTQLSTLGHVSNFFATEPQIELAERLLALLDAGRRQGVLRQLRRRGQRGRAQADPAHRPDPPGRDRGCASTVAPWERSRSPPRRPTASRSSRCPATSPSSRTATSRRWRPRSPTRPLPWSSSRSRARPAW